MLWVRYDVCCYSVVKLLEGTQMLVMADCVRGLTVRGMTVSPVSITNMDRLSICSFSFFSFFFFFFF